MSHFANHLPKIGAAMLLSLALSSCQNSTHIKGLPKNLPVINLHGSPKTPPHSMGHTDYPFEEDGDYSSAWASEGGQGAGMDYSSWRTSHGGSSSRSSKGSPSKKKTSSSKSKSSGRGGSYAIKSGDSLSTIARKNGTTVAKLKAANGLSSDMIRAGKTLKIPK